MRKTITAAALAAMVLSAGPASASSICGDVNDSGALTASDALSVLRAAVGQPVDLVCAPPGQPLKTGQTTAYGTGSDGDSRVGVERFFADNGDGTITDEATGLTWEKKDDSGGIHDQDNTYTWSTGTNDMDGTIMTTFLATLNGNGGFAGHTDWRVPNRFELETLVNMEAVSLSTYSEFNIGCVATCTVLTCSCTLSDSYWSSSTYQSFASSAFRVVFGSGGLSASPKTQYYQARAVRGGL